MTIEQKRNIGIGILVALGLQYILGRMGVGNLSFYILVILAIYLVFFSKK